MSASSCGNSSSENEKNTVIEESTHDTIEVTNTQFEHADMVIGTLETKNFPESIETTGLIDVPPQNRAIVSAIMGGYIKNTPLLIGDMVKKGQAVATIENPEFIDMQQKYLELKEQLTYLQSEYNRQKTLFAENITSQKNYLKAESKFNTAKAGYTGLRKRLNMLNISPSQVENGNITSVVTLYAPISGSVTEMNATKGLYVSPATKILEIIDNDHIHIELSVFEKDIMNVKKDQVIRFSIPEASSEIYDASVHLVGTAITANRTIKVHGHLEEDEKHNFLTGMFVDAKIVTSNSEMTSLPDTAIV
jgi:cobalt-zinc-cadmium efflux system membrane fusion protein